MSVASAISRLGTTAAELPLYRLSVDQFHDLYTQGILWSGCHVELIFGLLYEGRGPRPDDPAVDDGQFPIHRLRVDDYLAMHECGIITDETPVEFLEGLLVETMVRRPPHDTALGLLQDALSAVLPPGWILRVQSALQLTFRGIGVTSHPDIRPTKTAVLSSRCRIRPSRWTVVSSRRFTPGTRSKSTG
jgi:hypothetical protein